LTILICFGIPLGALLYALVRKRSYVRYFLFGVVGFAVFQIAIRVPLLNLITTTAPYIKLSLSSPYALAVLVAFSAALAEIIPRIGFLAVARKKEFDLKIPLFYGLGHGGIEAIYLLGIPSINILMHPVSMGYSDTIILGGFERIPAMILQVALSMLVYKGLYYRKISLVLAVVVLHTLIDTLALTYRVFGLSLIQVETVFLVANVVILLGALLVKRKKHSL